MKIEKQFSNKYLCSVKYRIGYWGRVYDVLFLGIGNTIPLIYRKFLKVI